MENSVSELVVAYDLVDAGFSADFPMIGLLFVGIGLLLNYGPKGIWDLLKPHSEKTKLDIWFARVFLGFGLVWTASVFVATYPPYQAAKDAYLSGDYEVVEGTVENFVAAGSGIAESFSVVDVPFRYSNAAQTPGFRTTALNSGPIREGVYVRITHNGNAIWRLEVEPSAMDGITPNDSGSIFDVFGTLRDKALNSDNGKPAMFSPFMLRFVYFAQVWMLFGIISVWWWQSRYERKSQSEKWPTYKRLMRSTALWGIAPVAVGVGVGTLTGWQDARFEFTLLMYGNLVILARAGIWLFLQNGGAILEAHPGFMKKGWVAKVYWVFAVLGIFNSINIVL